MSDLDFEEAERSLVNEMTLSHYSKTKVRKVHSTDQLPGKIGTYDKPKGFWVSVDGEFDWPSWCKAEDYGLERFKWRHVVTLRPGANILRISSKEELDKFSEEYQDPVSPTLLSPRFSGIDWHRVARLYQGIIISPYIWERRLSGHASWYYIWDCASGCIWDAKAIASIKAEKYELSTV